MLGRLSAGALTKSADETIPLSEEEFSSDGFTSDDDDRTFAARVQAASAKLPRAEPGRAAGPGPPILKTSPSFQSTRSLGGAVTFDVQQDAAPAEPPTLSLTASVLDPDVRECAPTPSQAPPSTHSLARRGSDESTAPVLVSPLTAASQSPLHPDAGKHRRDRPARTQAENPADGAAAPPVRVLERPHATDMSPAPANTTTNLDVSGVTAMETSHATLTLSEQYAQRPGPGALALRGGGGGGGRSAFGRRKLTLGDVDRRQVRRYQDAGASGGAGGVSEAVGQGASERARLGRLMSLMGRVQAKEVGETGGHIVQGFKLLVELQEGKAHGRPGPKKKEKEKGRSALAPAPFRAWNDNAVNSAGHGRAGAEEKRQPPPPRRHAAASSSSSCAEESSEEELEGRPASVGTPHAQQPHPHAMLSPPDERLYVEPAPAAQRGGGRRRRHARDSSSSTEGSRGRWADRRGHVRRAAALRSPKAASRTRRSRADRLSREHDAQSYDRVVRELAYEHMLAQQGYPPPHAVGSANPLGAQHLHYIHTEVNQQFGHLKQQHEGLIHQFIGVMKAERSAQEDLRKKQMEEHAAQLSSLKDVAEEAAAAKVAHQSRLQEMEAQLSQQKVLAEGQLLQLRMESVEAQRTLDAARDEQQRLKAEQAKLVQQAEESQATLRAKAQEIRREQHEYQQHVIPLQAAPPPAPVPQAAASLPGTTAQAPQAAEGQEPAVPKEKKGGFLSKFRGKKDKKEKKEKARAPEAAPTPAVAAPAAQVPMVPAQDVPIGVMMQRPSVTSTQAGSAGATRPSSRGPSSPEPVAQPLPMDDFSDATSSPAPSPKPAAKPAARAESQELSSTSSEPSPAAQQPEKEDTKKEKKRLEKEKKEKEKLEKKEKKAKEAAKKEKKGKKEKEKKEKKEKKDRAKSPSGKGGGSIFARLLGGKKAKPKAANSADGHYVISLSESTHLSVVHSLTTRLSGKAGSGEGWCYSFLGVDSTSISPIEKREVLKNLCESGPVPGDNRLNEKQASTLMEVCRYYGGTGLMPPDATSLLVKKKGGVKRDALKKPLGAERYAALGMVLDHFHEALKGVPIGTRERVSMHYAEAMCGVTEHEKKKKVAAFFMEASKEKAGAPSIDIPEAAAPAAPGDAASALLAPQESSSSSSSESSSESASETESQSPPPAQAPPPPAQRAARKTFDDSEDSSEGAAAAPPRFVPTGMEGYQLKQRGAGQRMVSG